MTPIEIYDSFIIKANENAQTDNIAVEKGRFTYLYNEASIKFIEWVLDKKNEDDIEYLRPILTTHKIIKFTGDSKKQLGELPDNYLFIGNVNAKASSECCTRVEMETWQIKTENENTIVNDVDNKPSIEYREVPYYIQENNIKFLVDNFKIDESEIVYYRYPTKIELNDPNDPESNFKSQDIPLEFDDKAINRIISIAVSDYDLNTNNPKFQGDKSRVVSKF